MRVRELAAARGWTSIGEAEWTELRNALPDVSESTIRGAGIPLEQPWRGVQHHTLDELESSLGELSEIYAARPDLRRYCRDQVIASKDRARWSSRSANISAEKRLLKAEMIDWMLVWLDDPSMFAGWAAKRREQICMTGDHAGGKATSEYPTDEIGDGH
jgi:hypothetical protein